MVEFVSMVSKWSNSRDRTGEMRRRVAAELPALWSCHSLGVAAAHRSSRSKILRGG